MAYSERRKDDRRHMADATEAMLRELGDGVRWERREGTKGGFPGPRCIRIHIEGPRGLCLDVEFDGDSFEPDVYVLSWHMSTDSGARLSDRFIGCVNPHHFGKAITIAEGFENLLSCVRTGFRMAQDGTAFDAEREAAWVAGTEAQS